VAASVLYRETGARYPEFHERLKGLKDLRSFTLDRHRRGTPMTSHIGRNWERMRTAAAMQLVLLISACAQTTRSGTGTPPGTPSTASTASTAPTSSSGSPQGMMVRISEIQIDPARLDEYNAILKEESEASVRLEPGVISIFPMYQREKPTEVRILEIYASRAAYQSHIQSTHFQKYKTTTLPKVKSLKLIDMETLDPATMPTIFGKMRSGK
jgi:quinol monooxygenase YgiN